MDLVDAAVVVQVVGLDVGHHGDLGREHQEGAVALVGLHRDDLADTGVGAQSGGDQLPADHVTGVDAQVLEDHGDHGGRGGLAVGSGDRDALTAQQEGPQGRGSGQDPQTPPARLGQLGVVLADRGGDHQGLGGVEVLGRVAHVDPRAHPLQVAQGVAVPGVAAGDLHTGLQQHTGDTGHAGPAQADEVGASQLVDGDGFGRSDQAHRASLPSS